MLPACSGNNLPIKPLIRIVDTALSRKIPTGSPFFLETKKPTNKTRNHGKPVSMPAPNASPNIYPKVSIKLLQT